MLGRGLARPGSAGSPQAARRPRRAVLQARYRDPQGFPHDDRGADHPEHRRPSDPGHLQEIQPQEAPRPDPESIPAVASLARLAERPTPLVSIGADAAKPDRDRP